MKVLGVDPGISGAIALITGGGSLRPTIEIADMPLKAEGSAERNVVDGVALAQLLDRWKPDVAYMELVWAREMHGRVAAGRFMRAFGVMEMALIAYVPGAENRFMVPPNKWKKRFGLSANKTASQNMIVDLFPVCAELVTRHKDDGRAEAGLIAAYGAERQGLFKMADIG